MRHKRMIAAILAASATLPAGSALAWGPDAQVAMVSAGTHLLGRDSAFSLDEMLKYVVRGASLTPEEQRALFPAFDIDPVSAIQREMILLQSVRGSRIDPYYAYRLGALGKIVAQATAPMATSTDATVRSQYYNDVENAISRSNLRMAARKLVDPRAYFSLVRSEAAKNDQTIVVDYRGGIGFRGFAQSALGVDASRSINAVADVWYTVLTAQMPVYDQPIAAKREYVLGAIAFYLGIGNLEEVKDTYQVAQESGMLDAEMRKQIGDQFFDTGHFDRAIVEYQGILETNPNRRDVIDRVAEYYEQAGDSAAEVGDLEEARDAYAKAVEANSLKTDAQRKLLNIEARIYARDERLLTQRSATDLAREFENRAEEAVARRDYAGAIALLREAETNYAGVTDEFPAEAKVASIGARNVSIRLKELKQDLVDNSQSLSGTNYAFDARQLAGQTDPGSVQALKKLIRQEYDTAVRALAEQGAPE